MDDSTRLKLVSSLYGPGTFSAWLLTLASVFISWTLNLRTRRKDTISNDFVATLALPAIASGHILTQIVSYSEASSFLFASLDNLWIQRSAAIEAPLIVCETFLACFPFFFITSYLYGHHKRSLGVLFVGIMAFSCELALFEVTRGLDILESNTTRPNLFMFPWFMVFISALFILIIIRIAAMSRRLWVRPNIGNVGFQQHRYRRWFQRHMRLLVGVTAMTHFDHSSSFDKPTTLTPSRRELTPPLQWDPLPQRIQNISYNMDKFDSYGQWGDYTSSGVYDKWHFSVGLSSIYRHQRDYSRTQVVYAGGWAICATDLLPETTTSIQDLDQAVAFAIGIITLAFSIHDAVKSRKLQATATSSCPRKWGCLIRFAIKNEKAPSKADSDLASLEDGNIARLYVVDTPLTRPTATYAGQR